MELDRPTVESTDRINSSKQQAIIHNRHEPGDRPEDKVERPRCGARANAPTWKSAASPRSTRDTEMAVADAPSAAIATRSSNRRTSSSRTKMAPARPIREPSLGLL